MVTTYYSDDDMPPELKALSARLRARAEAMGCECRPGVSVDTKRCVIEMEHPPSCSALRHSMAGGWSNQAAERRWKPSSWAHLAEPIDPPYEYTDAPNVTKIERFSH